MTRIPKPIFCTTLTVAMVLFAYEAHRTAGLAEQRRSLQHEMAPWMENAQRLERECAEATNRLASLTQEKTALQADSAEVARLRAEEPRLQEVSKKVARFEAVGATLPQLERWLANKNSPDTNRQLDIIQQSILNRYKSVAGLNADEEQTVRDLMLKQTDVRYQSLNEKSQGTLTREHEDELNQTYSNLTAQIDAIIPSDRRAALKDAADADNERAKELWVRVAADGELAMLQSWIGTSRDQEEQLFQIIYGLILKTRHGDTVSPSEKVDAVAKVLTPAQTELYRKVIEENSFQALIQTGPKR
jgi:hypothetical protein